MAKKTEAVKTTMKKTKVMRGGGAATKGIKISEKQG